jgi:magnesium-transporting ATPase (P-type)
MNNLCKPPQSPVDKLMERALATPLVTPLSVLMVILIYTGYAYFFFTSEEAGKLTFLAAMSFEIFLACQIAMILLTILARKQLDGFLARHPVISDQVSLESLKPVVRTNMLFALTHLLLLGLGSLTAIMSILNYGGMISLAVVAVTLVVARVTKWSTGSEERLKQIECTDAGLEKELTGIFHCWQHRPFPNF